MLVESAWSVIRPAVGVVGYTMNPSRDRYAEPSRRRPATEADSSAIGTPRHRSPAPPRSPVATMAAVPPPPTVTDLAPELESFRQNARHNATSSVLVVDGLPVVTAEKADKLLAALTKIFAKVGQLRYPADGGSGGGGVVAGGADGGGAGGGGLRPPIVIPRGGDGATLGFALVEYVDAEQAAIAAVATNRFQFGRSNTFAVANAAEVLRICAVADTFVAPPEPPVANIVAEKRINLKGWLLDGRGRDEFAVRHGLETDVMWHDPVLAVEKVRQAGGSSGGVAGAASRAGGVVVAGSLVS